ncbi:PaREP1 family protein [Caldivirga maquilingensis]|uniref:PaREP1 protein n=1 Tax=Caldivirga maquilingensis (strain ATCC 700844 / DSM 13496 / JCM 10307 / IC-167) TaxID=397948 RepID=A8ME55_CALMQ|nr:PaREP1 family protein [Caldivirga maquilingensis]ABW02061.1 PaREP1 protein [Caldivirga maquilingensis IC-167]
MLDSIPQSLLIEAERHGIDVVELLAKALSLDPATVSKAHLELAVKFLNEGKDLIDKDPIQASERLYKAAEEAIKAIAVALNLEEAKRASEISRWTTQLLFDAVDNASDKVGKRELRWWWGRAWFLHVEGFHEARLRPDQVRRDLPDVESLVEFAKGLSQSTT